MLISIHMPKTAGMSFKQLLRDHFKNKMLEDYVDFPDNWTFEQRMSDIKAFRKRLPYHNLKYFVRQVQCIHGHFLPVKFNGMLAVGKKYYITWLREPSERMASHYYYWLRTYSKEKSLPLHKKVVEENWSLEAFCFSEELRNIYNQFLWNFPKENLDFIGLTEFMDEDLSFFCNNFLNSDSLTMKNINNNKEKKAKSYFDDSLFVDKIKIFHAQDYELYNYALEKREKRL